MKLLWILLLSIFITVQLSAQELLTFRPKTLKKQVTIEFNDAGYEEVLKINVTNTSERTLKLRWDKDIIHQPYAWESQICDKEASYPPNVESNYNPIQGIIAPVSLSPGESFDLYLTLLPYNKTGQCKIEIPFREVHRPSKIIGTAVFQVNITSNQDEENNNRNGDKRIRIFPNPVHEHFFLTNTPALNSLEIYNTLGRRVKTFDSPEIGDSFDAGDLPQGVYLIRLRNKKGKVIRTLRLLRRDFRP